LTVCKRCIYFALFLLLFPSNVCRAWDIKGSDDHDFWRQAQQNDWVLDEQRRARKRRDEEIKKFDDERDQLKRRNRTLFKSEDDDYLKLDHSDDEKDKSSDLNTLMDRRAGATRPYKVSKLMAVHDQLGDWVPSKPDPLQNGGFGISIGNGRPVPYKLNGHINIERKLPWQDDN